METFRSDNPAPASISAPPPSFFAQRTFVPGRVRLISSTDPNYDAPWAAARAMAALDAPRPKRIRAQVNYVEPTELDEDIVDDEPAAAVVASDDHVSDTDLDAIDVESDSGSDQEFTTNKRKIKAQQKKKAAKKGKKKKAKKIKDVPFPFMELPLEIRFMIYKACLVESARELSFVSKSTSRDVFRGTMKRSNHRHYGYTYKTKRERSNDPNRTALQPVILRVNKAIRDEALPYLYAQTFHFVTTQTFHQWFARISPANRMLLRSVVIKGWTDYRSSRAKDVQHVFSLLMSATNIRSVLLDRHVWSETNSPTNIYYNKNFTGNAANFWLDIQYWADAMDAAHGKGAAKAALNFTKVCFGSIKEIEDEDEIFEKREKDFMAQLMFSEKAEKVKKTEETEKAEQ
ncbi:hypothetical protein E4T50_09190 [Aureobasidium sp. EXF-12298]|nr:hypothetical protein E4T50_09190 [Aureobasidium sp. EXF-12298]